MKTELSPEITRTCSKGHGKIANNKFHRLCRISLDMTEITSGCNVQSYQTTSYSKLSWQNRVWNANTKDKEQNSPTELIPKINRKDGSIHSNMANDMTDSDMAGTMISRHVGKLVQLTTEQYMALQGDHQ